MPKPDLNTSLPLSRLYPRFRGFGHQQTCRNGGRSCNGGYADLALLPSASDVADWHSSANGWFAYRYCWGLGSVIGVSFDQIHNGQLLPAALDQWAETQLPWVVFWLKELVTWGTLEPVAAFLLVRGRVRTRGEAETLAKNTMSQSSPRGLVTNSTHERYAIGAMHVSRTIRVLVLRY